MVASHNQKSIEHTVAGLAARNLPSKGSGVYFGQLLGMADNLTFTLGQHGYEAFKYVPYGPIELVMPYLVRRAQENSAIMGAGVDRQIKMVRQEIWRRLTNSA
jgi:proline dehydrogenase